MTKAKIGNDHGYFDEKTGEPVISRWNPRRIRTRPVELISKKGGPGATLHDLGRSMRGCMI